MDEFGHIAGEQLVAHRVLQARAQDRMGELHTSALHASGPKVLAPEPNVANCERPELLVADPRADVQPDDELVPLIGLGRSVWLDHRLEPVLQVRLDGPVLDRHPDARVELLLKVAQFLPRLSAGVAIDHNALAAAGVRTGVGRADPAAVLHLVDRAFTVGALGHADSSTIRSTISLQAWTGTRRRRPILIDARIRIRTRS